MRAEQDLGHVPLRTPVKQHLLQLLLKQARENSKVAVVHKRDGRWQEVTWPALLERVRRVSDALVRSGVKPGERVAIFAATSFDWVVWDLAINAAEAIVVPIYPSNTADECRYAVTNSGASVLFVDDDASDGKQPGRLSRVRSRLEAMPELKTIYVLIGAGSDSRERPASALEESGTAAPSSFEQRVERLDINAPACLVYTSGATGDPKGVILTLANWGYEAQAVEEARLLVPEDSAMLFLPLAHVFAQVVKSTWLVLGLQLIFAESMDKLLAGLAETRPTVLPAVPRVFEKIFAAVVANGQASPGLKGRLFKWAYSLFEEYVEARLQGREYTSLEFALARKLVFSKIRSTISEKLGGKMRVLVSGGAPLAPKIAYFFDLLGFQVLEGYGLTETSASATCNRPGGIKIGTVGPALPGTELKIAPDGEVLIRGGGVMKGYYRNPEATAEAITQDGWFHTGDIGELDAQGYLKITDRKKDIIVTAGGKKIPPQNLENQLKTFPLVAHAMVFGDGRNYLTVLLSLGEESMRKLLESQGQPAGSYAEMVGRPAVRTEVQRVIQALNAELPPHATLKKWALADHEFSQETGEITPTLKVKRKYCVERYRVQLEGMYS